MLVLSRERGESIRIGDDITVTCVDIRGDLVRFGIDAPRNIPVHRSEIHDIIQREKCQNGTDVIEQERRACRDERESDIDAAKELAGEIGPISLGLAKQFVESFTVSEIPTERFQALLMKIGLSLVAESLAQGE